LPCFGDEQAEASAGEGDAEVQFLLGTMYYNGDGVPMDYQEAAKWYRLAADQGDADAQHNLGRMYYNGYGVPMDYVVAHMWLNLSASQGNENAKKGRDISTSHMTPAQITEAQTMARKWMAAHPDI